MVKRWLLAVMVFAGHAGAEDFYWQESGADYAGKPRYGSANEACFEIGDPKRTSNFLGMQITNGGKSGECRFELRGFKWTAYFYLKGDSCPPGKVWSDTVYACVCPPGSETAEDGSCLEPPPCDAGATLLTRGPNSAVTTVSGRVYVLSTPPSSVCSAGCQYVTASSKAASCFLVSGSSDTGFCNYSMTSDGERCSGDEASAPDVGDAINPEEPPDSPTQPSDPNDPGCPVGQAWSGTDCTQEPTSGGDGGESGNGGEDGPDDEPCDRDGTCWEEGDSGSSGNGSGNGSGNSSGDGSGSGSSDGDGFGDGDGDGGGECDPDQGYVCGGGKGPGSGLNAPEAGSWDKANEEWDQRLEDAKKELKDQVKANVDQMKSAFNLQLSAGGGKLPCDSITVWGKSYRFCVADYGDQLANLRLALLLMAAVIAALIVLKD